MQAFKLLLHLKDISTLKTAEVKLFRLKLVKNKIKNS
jgi:hypothetical protein